MRFIHVTFVGLIGFLYSSFSFAQFDAATLATKATPYWLMSDTALDEIRRCTPSAQIDQVERWRKATGFISTFHDRNNNRFMSAANDIWVCMSLSPTGYTVFPLSTLEGALNIKGVAADKTASLFRRVQAELANTGYARALIAFKDGKRQIVYFSAEQKPSPFFTIRSITVDSGRVNDADFPISLLEIPSNLSIRTIGNDDQASVFTDLIAPRALRGNYLRIAGNTETSVVDFAGTTWRSVRSPSESITFEFGGVLLQKTKNNNVLGNWAKDGNAIYFDNKFLYQSGAVIQSGEIKVLDTQTRRLAYIPQAPVNAAPNAPAPQLVPEFRGTNSYFRVGDKQAEAIVMAAWQARARGTKETIERSRQQRLAEAQGPDWDGKTNWWSLCTVTNFSEARLVSELDDVKEPEVCRVFFGTRRAWQAILQEGCNNRCAAINVPIQ